MRELLLILFVLASLYVDYIVAKKFEEIAFQKGYDESIHSLAMCFWLGIVGYLYVIALPELKMQDNVNGNTIKQEPKKEIFFKSKSPKKEEYDQLVAKAEKYKNDVFDRNYNISIYESIIKDMKFFANEKFEDAEAKLSEYESYLESLKRQ